MQGIGLGVGDVGEVPGVTWCAGYQAIVTHEWREGRKCDGELVD